MTIDQFKKKHKIKPRRSSVLDPFQVEILQMRSEDITYADIVKFLEENGVQDQSIQNVSAYVKRLQKNANKQPKRHVKSNPIVEDEIQISNETLDNKKEDDNQSSEDQLFNVDIKKRVGKDTELKKPEWV